MGAANGVLSPVVRSVCVSLCVVGWILCLSGPARADVAKGRALLADGDYAGATRELTAAPAKERAMAQTMLARLAMLRGDLSGAETLAGSAVKVANKGILAAHAQVVLAEIELLRGNYAAAHKQAQSILKKAPAHLGARLVAGRALLFQGRTDEARRVFESFYDDWDAGKIDQKSAPALLAVAIAARYTGGYEDANDMFREALAIDPTLHEANLEWGALFLDKYAAGSAERCFQEVLAKDAQNPDAHAGMAAVRLEQGNLVEAREQVALALTVNQRHADALLVRAQIEIDDGRLPDAKQTLALIFATNPRHVRALAVLAAANWLADEDAAFAEARAKALAIDPRAGELYLIVADFAGKAHRYPEAIELLEQGLKVDPGPSSASAKLRAALGLGYLRLGDEKKGVELLQAAFAKDPFNVRAYNTLELYEKIIPRDYDLFNSKSLRFRVPKVERAILERVLPALLEPAWTQMVARYGLVPPGPVTLELYADPDHYSVRTIGLPDLGALGVCFGRVITALSPSTGRVNWAMVLWHELGHVFALSLSKGRVPRWYTEGLSEVETIKARSEWRRENDKDVWLALKAKRLPSVVELDRRFTQARSMEDMVVAYHMSSLAIEFLVDRWGFPKVVQGLRLFGAKKSQEQVLTTISGLSVTAFDQAFHEHLRKRFAVYENGGGFWVDLRRFEDRPALDAAAKAAPKDAQAQAAAAAAAFLDDALPDAIQGVARALALSPKLPLALYLDAQLAIAAKDIARARSRLDLLIASKGDGYDARSLAAELASESGDDKAAMMHWEKAARFDPERSEPWAILAKMRQAAKDEPGALAALEAYVRLEEMDFPPLRSLVQKFAAKKDWAKVVTYGERSVDVYPFDAEMHLALGDAYVQLARPTDALRAFDSALICDPPLRRPALAHRGRAAALLALGRKAEAGKATAKAKALEPGDAGASKAPKGKAAPR